MRIATWNVNSLNARLPRVEEWLGYARPDVLCMQETKLADAAFPAMAFSALGYESASHGDGRWNGVAVAQPGGARGRGAWIRRARRRPGGSRLVSATCGGVRVHSVYVPNGRVGRQRALRGQAGVAGRAARLPGAHRANRPTRWRCAATSTSPPRTATSGTRPPSRGRRTSPSPSAPPSATSRSGGSWTPSACGHPEDELFTWWDYRAGNFHKHMGLRIDLVLVSRPLADECHLRPRRPKRPQGQAALGPRPRAGGHRRVGPAPAVGRRC